MYKPEDKRSRIVRPSGHRRSVTIAPGEVLVEIGLDRGRAASIRSDGYPKGKAPAWTVATMLFVAVSITKTIPEAALSVT